MTDSTSGSRSEKPTDAEVAETLGFVDGALGAAGHKVDDPETRELLRRQAAGELTADEAIALYRQQENLD